jgi:tetratricopeptide (TPR) repeat protein
MTKEELRHDSFVEAMGNTTAWVQRHFMAVLLAILVLAIAVFAGVWMGQSRTRASLQASKLLHDASLAYSGGQYSQSLLTLEDLIARYGGSRAGKDAVYLAGASHLALGENDRALERFRQYLQDSPRGGFAQSANLGLGLALEARGERAEALAQFVLVQEAVPGEDPLYAQAGFARARVLAALGQSAEAATVLEALERSEDFTVRSEAESRLAVLRALSGPS